MSATPSGSGSSTQTFLLLYNNSVSTANAASAVQAAGGTMDREPMPFGNTGIVIGIAADPAGNRIELIQRPQR